MQIAIPTDNENAIYHDNAYTAPKFSIYTIIIKNKTDISFSLQQIIYNPLSRLKCEDFDETQLKCSCDKEHASNLHHIYEHYSLLDLIAGCQYLLATRYCKNVIRSMKNGGILIYKIPPIIKNADNAIKNFLIGASFANTAQHIHHAS
ncbi:MAG: hypothetical protein PHX13_01650 [Thiovulaceae bacterium]|nr:hypothetical protein [Sulfurimonadaceae bacterium]